MSVLRQPLLVRGNDIPLLPGALSLLAGVFFILNGCKGPTDMVESRNPPDDAATNVKIPRVSDHTEAGCPPELLAQVMALVPGRDLSIYDRRYTWLSKHLIRFETDYAENIMFVRRNGGYAQVNSKDNMEVLNEILQERKFPQSGFKDIAEIESFLSVLVKLYGDFTYCFVGSSLFVKWTERTYVEYGGTADWVRGTEKDISVFLDLCRDPVFVLQDNAWTVVFNVFKASGGVDQWRVTGKYDPKTERNSVQTIDITNIKPKGTFSPVMSR
jgi:hypothetical protein